MMSAAAAVALTGAAWAGVGCQPAQHREKADEIAYQIVEQKQEEALGRTEPFTIETPADTLRRRLIGVQALPIVGPESLGTDQLPPIPHWPEADYPARGPADDLVIPPWDPAEPLALSLIEALQVAARNSRQYQDRKEDVFRTALDLDLEALAFRTTYFGLIEGLLVSDQRRGITETRVEGAGTLQAQRRLQSGALLTSRLGIDLAKLLTSDGRASLGLVHDFSVTIPLLRGAGRHIVAEPLTQAERDVIYAIWDFERFKKSFAVQVATAYYQTLQREDEVINAEESYRRLVVTVRRQRALAEVGRLSRVELDQALQDELRARASWIRAMEQYQNTLDNFKFTLGLPTDAHLALDRAELALLVEETDEVLGEAAREAIEEELEELPDEPLLDDLQGLLEDRRDAEQPPERAELPELIPADAPVELEEPSREDAGPYELPEDVAVPLALDHRLDLHTREGRVYDAQRRVVVAANALHAGLNLVGDSVTTGQYRLTTAGETVPFRFGRGVYSAGFELDLPLERTAERNVYRDAYVSLERAVRDVQELEDGIKLEIRAALRELERAREDYVIQTLATALAEERVEMTTMLQEVGRAEVRDLLEAEAALLAAQNALTGAVISYRLTELELQRDMGVLLVDETGLWSEFDLTDLEPEQREQEDDDDDENAE